MLLVGRLSPRKGTDTALAAVEVLVSKGHDVHLTLVGDVFPGYEWFKEQLERDARKKGILDRITFAGFVADPVPHYAAADIVLVPSRTEPFGTVAAEGMAAGRCTVVARVQGLVEIVDNSAIGGTFEPGDYQGLAQVCAGYLQEPDHAAVVAAAGRQSILERFSVEQYEAGTVSVVRRLTKER
jgi:glycosyltransferase involved in cell wall biosynthesis